MGSEHRSPIGFCLKIFLVTVLIEVAFLFKAHVDSPTQTFAPPVHDSPSQSSTPPDYIPDIPQVQENFFVELGNKRTSLQGGDDLGTLVLSESDRITFKYSIVSDWIAALSISNNHQTIMSPGFYTKPVSFTVTGPITKIETQMTMFMGQFSVLKGIKIYTAEDFKTIGTWDDRDKVIQTTPNGITITKLSLRGSTGAIDALGVYYSNGTPSSLNQPINEDNPPPAGPLAPVLPASEEVFFMEIGNERIGSVGSNFYQGGYDKGVLVLTDSDHIKFQYSCSSGPMVNALSMTNGKQTVKSSSIRFDSSFTVSTPITKIECQLGTWRIYTVMKSLRIYSEEGVHTICEWDEKDASIKSTPGGISIHSLSLRSDAAIDAIGVKYTVNK